MRRDALNSRTMSDPSKVPFYIEIACSCNNQIRVSLGTVSPDSIEITSHVSVGVSLPLFVRGSLRVWTPQLRDWSNTRGLNFEFGSAVKSPLVVTGDIIHRPECAQSNEGLRRSGGEENN
jgi:hypothetical protein